MSWMQKLCQVYEAAERHNQVGDYQAKPVLLPLYHGTQQAQIELTIDGQGELVRGSARAIANKDEMETIIPVTEKSASRTSSPEPMPLFDKLVYVAGDFHAFFPEEKERNPSHYRLYLGALEAWCASGHAHGEVLAWLAYVRKGTLVRDLLSEGIFTRGEGGAIATKWAGGGKPEDAFVRFLVRQEGQEPHAVWLNPDVAKAFIAYQHSLPAEEGLCYATGKIMPTSSTSPKFIRYPGDNAKLISANDLSGFTFRGRFETAEEALCLGRDTTEKAHAALKWLIRKQGARNGDQVMLAFTTGEYSVPPAVLDTVGVIEDDSLEGFSSPARESLHSTGQANADMLANAIHSLSGRIPDLSEAIVMGLDSATPGRMAIFYYREMGAKDYLARIQEWHTTCTWRHTYQKITTGYDDNGKKQERYIVFEGAPSLMDIVLAAYGEKVSDKLKKSAVERLVPCVVDRAHIPQDIINTLVNRAAQRAFMDGAERDKVLSIVCALIKRERIKKGLKGAIEVAVDEQYNNRDYLFGRALAYAEMIERAALDNQGEDRITNAERLMVAFTNKPAKALDDIQRKLKHYQNKGSRIMENWFEMWNDSFYDVIDRLKNNGFTNDRLGEEYLLGYASQRMKLKGQYYAIKKSKSAKAPKEEE